MCQRGKQTYANSFILSSINELLWLLASSPAVLSLRGPCLTVDINCCVSLVFSCVVVYLCHIELSHYPMSYTEHLMKMYIISCALCRFQAKRQQNSGCLMMKCPQKLWRRFVCLFCFSHLHHPQSSGGPAELLALTCFLPYLCSDSGYKADGEMAAGRKKQPEQVWQLHLEDADSHPPQ